MLTKETIDERRLRFLEIAGDGLAFDQSEGMLNVAMQSWAFKGPGGADFRFDAIRCAEAVYRDISLKLVLRYWKDGDHVDQFLWGHPIQDAYVSSVGFRRDHERQWSTELIATRVFRRNLPCCGGVFRSEREITHYSCLSIGKCDWCGMGWTCADGYVWQSDKSVPNK